MDKYIGKRLDGRYEILEVIGVGGMAVVYRAHDVVDDQIVAVKILKDEYLNNEEYRRRFKNECKAIAVLSHPNIIKVYDVSFGDRLEYIVMEHVDGITLKEYIEQQKVLRWKEAVHFTVQILRALQHAHEKGIVHRDIKPQNIMLLQDGTIKVTDFGIARFSRTESHTMSSEKAIGSVHYISPEQARGEITDERTDIYSVGVMLYEMLSGRLPFEADSAVSVAIMQMQSEPKPLHEINGNIPEGLEEITMRAMQKDASKRYQSAAEMLQDIEAFKKNPSIHFEYKYFVDDNPTRLVDSINQVKTSHAEHPEEIDPDGEVIKPKKKLSLPVLGGIAAVVVVFVGLLIVLSMWFSGILSPNNENDYIELPSFVGMTMSEAQEQYKELIFEEETSRYSAEYEKGVIIDQNPGATKKVPKYTTVKVTLSLGKEIIKVPNVAGQSAESAKAMLTQQDLKFEEISIDDPNTPKDWVVKTEPASGEEVAKGSTVKLYISNGASTDSVSVPPILGISEENARTLLQSKGLNVGSVTKEDSDSPANEVLSCSPDVGTQVAKGATVNLVVSSGNKPKKSATLSVPLPQTSTPVNMRVYVNGAENASLARKGLRGDQAEYYTFELSGTGQAEVTVTISASDTGYVNYAIFSVDFDKGEAQMKTLIPFKDSSGGSSSQPEPDDGDQDE